MTERGGVFSFCYFNFEKKKKNFCEFFFYILIKINVEKQFRLAIKIKN